MKKIFRRIYLVLLWIMYLALTGKQRQMYEHAKHVDREVLDVKNDAFGSTYTLGKKLFGKEPERDFVNWKEFKENHNF